MNGRPTHEQALVERARRFAGWTLGELAAYLGAPLAVEVAREKGAVGHIVERALGARAGVRPEPDLPGGIELKTLPVDRRGRPAESTFVTTVTTRELDTDWCRSAARRKLARVLFVPVEAPSVRPFIERRLGTAFLWSPNRAEEAILETDWTSLVERLLVHGEIDATRGVALQVRPKGRSSTDRTLRTDAEGAPIVASKCGFYLRASFTAGIVRASGLAATRCSERGRPPRAVVTARDA